MVTFRAGDDLELPSVARECQRSVNRSSGAGPIAGFLEGFSILCTHVCVFGSRLGSVAHTRDEDTDSDPPLEH